MTTDADGSFRFMTLASRPSLPYVLRIEKAGFVEQTLPVPAPSDEGHVISLESAAQSLGSDRLPNKGMELPKPESLVGHWPPSLSVTESGVAAHAPCSAGNSGAGEGVGGATADLPAGARPSQRGRVR